MSYTVTAKRWEHGWELHIAGAGVTQCRRLTEAERMVRDYLRLDGHPDYATATIIVEPEVDGLEVKAAKAHREAERAARAQAEAASKIRGVALALRKRGLSGSEVAVVLGVSPQRVSQIVGARKGKRPAKKARVKA
jgi:hypothetical protein